MTCKSLRILFVATVIACIFLVYLYILLQKSSSSTSFQINLSIRSNGTDLLTHFETVAKQNEQLVRSSGILPPYFHQYSQYLVAPHYHLATCQIPKNMATIRFSIFCFLSNTDEFLRTNRTLSAEFWNYSFCGNQFHRDDIDSTLDMASANRTLFAVVRHPIDRFLSGYVDRCLNHQLCFGCKTDLRCFVESLHRTLIEYYFNPVATVQDHSTMRLVRHFSPQTWYCDFKNHKNDYEFIEQHGGSNGTWELANEFDALFKTAGVPSNLRAIIHSELLKGTTVHTTAGSRARKKARQELLTDSYLIEHVMQMYYYDFIEFGFAL